MRCEGCLFKSVYEDMGARIDICKLHDYLPDAVRACDNSKNCPNRVTLEEAKKKLLSPDVVEVRHGEWNKKIIYSYNWDDFYSLTCSECGANIGETSVKAEDFKYCFNCGAKMDRERSNNDTRRS